MTVAGGVTQAASCKSLEKQPVYMNGIEVYLVERLLLRFSMPRGHAYREQSRGVVWVPAKCMLSVTRVNTRPRS